MEKKWYVLRVISGQENKIKGDIIYEVDHSGFNDQLETVLIPTERVFQVRNGKKVTKEKVYFPGYIAVHANLEGEMAHVIKSVNGVIGFLSETKGGAPVSMREIEVQRLLGKMDELSEEKENIAIPFVVGETVKVSDGAFNGFNGVIENINEQKRKLEVMVKIFGRKTPIELNYTQVEKIL